MGNSYGVALPKGPQHRLNTRTACVISCLGPDQFNKVRVSGQGCLKKPPGTISRESLGYRPVTLILLAFFCTSSLSVSLPPCATPFSLLCPCPSLLSECSFWYIFPVNVMWFTPWIMLPVLCGPLFIPLYGCFIWLYWRVKFIWIFFICFMRFVSLVCADSFRGRRSDVPCALFLHTGSRCLYEAPGCSGHSTNGCDLLTHFWPVDFFLQPVLV